MLVIILRLYDMSSPTLIHPNKAARRPVRVHFSPSRANGREMDDVVLDMKSC